MASLPLLTSNCMRSPLTLPWYCTGCTDGISPSLGAGPWTELVWATEAENFFKVPPAILQDAREYKLEITLSAGRGYGAVLKGADLAAEKSSLALEILP